MSKRAVIHGPVSAFGVLDFPKHELAPAHLMFVGGTFTADATVGNRLLYCAVMSPEGIPFGTLSLGQVTAGQTVDFWLCSGLTSIPARALDNPLLVNGGVPACGLWPGARVRLYDAAVISAGDNWGYCSVGLCPDD